MIKEKKKNELFDSIFFKKYLKQMMTELQLLYPDKDKKELRKIIKKNAKKKFQNKDVILRNNYEDVNYKISLLKLNDWIYEKKPIITGSGSFFKQDVKNLSADMLQYFLDTRSVYKGKMFKCKDAKDDDGFELNNGFQKTYKEYANSYYGAMGEENSIFFNPYTGNATTWTGRVITTSAVLGFEALFGNIIFEKSEHLVHFIHRTLIEEKEPKDFKEVMQDRKLVVRITKNIVKERLMSQIMNHDYMVDEKIEQMFDTLSKRELIRLYFKCNFYEFIKLPHIASLIKYLSTKDLLKIDNYIYRKEDKMDKETLEHIDYFWDLIERYCAYYYFFDYRWKSVENYKRKFILTIDTDSTFVYLGPFVDYTRDVLKVKVKDTKKNVSVSNILTYVCAKYVDQLFWNLTTVMNVEESKRPKIHMKNEFFIDKIILTRNKKQYVTSVVAQEGTIFTDKEDPSKIVPEINYVGLQLKKSTVNKDVREFFSKLIDEEIILKEDFDMGNILKRLYAFREQIMKEILEERSMKYSENKRFNAIDSYKFPFRENQVRGAIVWNALYPTNPIIPGTKCAMYKVNLPTLESILPIKKKNPAIYKKLKDTVFLNDELSRFGVATISMPISLKKVPLWITPYIDARTAADDNLRHFLIILEAFNIKSLKVGASSFFSNVLEV